MMAMGFVLGEEIGPCYPCVFTLHGGATNYLDFLPSLRFLAHGLALTSTKVPRYLLVPYLPTCVWYYNV